MIPTKRLIARIGLFVAFLTLLVFVMSVSFREEIQSYIAGDVAQYGRAAVVLAAFLLELFPQYVSPHLIIVNAKILNLPLMQVIALSSAGAIAGSVLGFKIGKFYGPGVLQNFYEKKKLKKVNEKIEIYGRWFIAIAAVSPLPYLPAVFGAFELKWKTFILYGILPRIIGFTILGLIIS